MAGGVGRSFSRLAVMLLSCCIGILSVSAGDGLPLRFFDEFLGFNLLTQPNSFARLDLSAAMA